MARGRQPSPTISTEKSDRARSLEEKAALRRRIMLSVMQYYRLSQKDWCQRAGIVHPSALGNFMSGSRSSPKSLNVDTLEPLAKSVGLTVSHLLGEVDLPWEPGSEAPTLHDAPTAATTEQIRVAVEGQGFQGSWTVPARRLARIIQTIMNNGDDTSKA